MLLRLVLSLPLLSQGDPFPNTPEPYRAARPQAATTLVSGLAYSAEYTRTERLDAELWQAHGSVRWSWDGARLFIDGEVTAPGAEARPMSVAYESGFWLISDHQARTWTRGEHADAAGLAGSVLAGLAVPAGAGDPLQGCRQHDGTQRFGTVLCRVFECVEPDRRTVWYIGEEDRLPRFVGTTTHLAGNDRLVERLTVREPARSNGLLAAAVPPEGYREVAAQGPAAAEPESAAPGQPASELTSLGESLDPLVAHFETQRGKTRWIGLFAPS